jgi:hypothetical protein
VADLDLLDGIPGTAVDPDALVGAELVLPTEVTTHLRAEQAPALERFAEADVRLYETSAALPFGLFVADSPDGETVAIELRDGGLVTGILVNDTPDAVRWARPTIERYRRDAERFL